MLFDALIDELKMSLFLSLLKQKAIRRKFETHNWKKDKPFRKGP